MRRDREYFAEWLSRTLAERDIAGGEVARALGVNDSAISRWKNGKATPGLDSLPPSALASAPAASPARWFALGSAILLAVAIVIYMAVRPAPQKAEPAPPPQPVVAQPAPLPVVKAPVPARTRAPTGEELPPALSLYVIPDRACVKT